MDATPAARILVVDDDEENITFLLRSALRHFGFDVEVAADGRGALKTVRADGTTAVVEVADDGPGMTAEVAGRVFERFYRADPARVRAGGGSGLGLAIVAGIAEAHAGTAEVESTPGTGARFRLRLPCHAVPARRSP